MNMSQYKKTCTTCGKEIQLSNDSGKWKPFNLDGSFHFCAEQTGTKKVETKPLTLEALDARLKKVEAMFNGGLQK